MDCNSSCLNRCCKYYVDAQVGSADTLQEVTDNGNSSSNSIKITGGATEGGNSVQLVYNSGYAQLQLKGSTGSFLNFSDGSTDFKGRIFYINSDNSMRFITNTSEKMRLSAGNLAIGNTSPQGLLHITKSNATATFEIQGGLTSITASDQIHGEINFGVNDASATGGIAGSIKSITENSNGAHNGLSFYTGQQSRTPYLQRAMQIRNTGAISFGSIENAHGNSGQILKSNGDASPTWVDASSVIGGPYLPLTGGTLTGSLTGTTATFNSGTTNTVATFISSDSGAGIKLTDNTGSSTIQTTDAQLRIGVDEDGAVANSTIGFRVDGSTKMTLTSGGNLLLGTTSSTLGKLQVNSVAGGYGIVNTNGTVTVGTYIEASNSYASFGTFSNQGLGFFTNNSAPLMFISTSGNVLIGTNSDSGNKLTVKGSIGIQRSVNTAESTINMEGNFNFVAAGGYSHRFEQNGTEVARIVPNGNLLLGTTTDSGSRLQVVGVSYFNGNVLIENNNELRWKDSGGSQRTILELTNANDLYFGGSFAGSLIFIGGGSYTERARISDSGNFLIATATDSGVYRLDVSGKARVQSVFELDDVLTLNQISTPADPASGKSSIYMDSADGAIKCKINVGGTVVTRTLASFE